MVASCLVLGLVVPLFSDLDFSVIRLLIYFLVYDLVPAMFLLADESVRNHAIHFARKLFHTCFEAYVPTITVSI